MLVQLEALQQTVQALKSNKGTAQPQEFFYQYETVRGNLDAISKQLVSEEREMRKLSCRISDYASVDVFTKFSELLHNTFILKKSYSTRKYVHYFEWGTKNIHFYDVDK